MEEERRINWLSLFIKIVIIFIFALIIMWLISKIIGRKELSKTFTNNLNNMDKVAVEYFKSIDLPEEKGQSKKITLKEMIDKELIVSIAGESSNNCDTKESYSKITRNKKDYSVETTLKCGKEKDTKESKFSFKDCKNCNQNNDKEENNSNNENTTNNENNNTSNSSTSNSGVTYYEHIKETTEYTKWMRGSVTGDNIENKYEYYSVAEATYYSLSYIKLDDIDKNNTFTYTLKLDNVPNSKYYFTTIKESNYFDSAEEKEYLKEKDISMYKGNDFEDITNCNSISKYSLNSNNFTYKLSPYYRRGSFYVDVTITISNTNNVSSYSDSKLKNIVFIPIKINLQFASPEIVTAKPSGDYITIPYYRYVVVNKEVKWSTENYLEGYTKTGNTKIN